MHRGDDRHVVERRAERGAVPDPLRREQVRDDRAGDELVADAQALVLVAAHEPVLEGLGEARGEVRLQAAGAAPGERRRARREAALAQGLERLGRVRQPRRVHRPLRRGEDPEHATALRGAARQPGGDEVRERPGERRAPQLAPRRDELLHDQRRPGGALGDQHDDRRGRALALDPLDQAGDLAPGEGREVHADRRPEPGLDHGQVLAQRVLARQPVGLVGQDQADPLVAGDPGDERREGAGGGVGDVEVLEGDDEGPLRRDAPEPSQQRLEGARLAALGVGQLARPRLGDARGERGEPRDLLQDRARVPGEEGAELVRRAGDEQRRDRVEDGRPGRIGGTVRLAAQDERRPGSGGRPLEHLVEEPADAHAGAPGDDDRRRRTRRRAGDRLLDLRDLGLASDEPTADDSPRHAGHCRGADRGSLGARVGDPIRPAARITGQASRANLFREPSDPAGAGIRRSSRVSGSAAAGPEARPPLVRPPRPVRWRS